MADILKNQMGSVLVVAPSPTGRLARLVEYRNVVLRRGGEQRRAILRWIFADVPRDTLTDDWGNRYDHQVHSLLAGGLDEGRAFLQALADQGYVIEAANDFFVPLQTLDAFDSESSDRLRFRHPRAFALAQRQRVTPQQLVTAIRDAMVFG